MKRNKRILKRKEQGITLIALVITIIVLLILAGVSIAMLTGENGILTQAQNAKNKTDKATEEEKINMAVLGSSVTDNGYAEVLEETSFRNELKNQFEDQKLDVVANGDGSFIVTVVDTNRKYYINDDKAVINSDNIIEISTAEELANLSQDVKNGNTYEEKAILLTNNIDLEGEEWTPIGYYPMSNSSPADESNKPFKGIFDGCGYEVDNFTINTTDKVQGLFGLVDNGKVANVGIGSNSSINGGTGTAGVIGYAYNGTKVYNCYNKANTYATSAYNGGIIGIAVESCKIVNCYNEGSINSNGTDCAGGIVGTIEDNVLIENCYNIGDVTANAGAGGILGFVQFGGLTGNYLVNCEINECYNKGNIVSTGKNDQEASNAGGIVGFSRAIVSNCYNTGMVTGQFNDVGGIEGMNQGGTLENCYNTGIVSGAVAKTGGIVGENFNYTTNGYQAGKIVNCYSLEGVATNLYGVNEATIGSECSFKTSDELKSLYEVLGNAFKEDTENKNNGYPILSWE